MECVERHPDLSPRVRPDRAVRPRVAFVSCHRPWPPVSGGRRREWELLRRLSAQADVHLVVVSKTEGSDPAPEDEPLTQLCRSVDVFAAQPRFAPVGAPEQVRRHCCPQASARVTDLLRRGAVDLVHVEGYYLMQHLPSAPGAPVVLVEQNVEYELAYQRAAVHPPGPERVALFGQALRVRAAETQAWRRATHLVAVTDEDRAAIAAQRAGVGVAVVPDGADHLAAAPVPGDLAAQRDLAAQPNRARDLERSHSPLIVLVANYAYAPNVDAARHLCLDILPELRRSVPNACTWLVGNAPPDEVRDLACASVRVTGRVADVAPYLDAADVVVCPLRIGGGIKVKTIEALRRGRAIVCTPVGAQGLPEQARRAMVIASDPAAFATAVSALLRDPGRRERLQLHAHRAAQSLPSWDDAARALTDVYAQALDRRPHREAGALGLARERTA